MADSRPSPIFAFDGESVGNAVFRDETQIQDFKIWPRKTTVCDVWCKAYFDVLNRLGTTHECDERTEGQTDRHSKGKCRDSLFTLRDQKRKSFEKLCQR